MIVVNKAFHLADQKQSRLNCLYLLSDAPCAKFLLNYWCVSFDFPLRNISDVGIYEVYCYPYNPLADNLLHVIYKVRELLQILIIYCAADETLFKERAV